MSEGNKHRRTVMPEVLYPSLWTEVWGEPYGTPFDSAFPGPTEAIAEMNLEGPTCLDHRIGIDGNGGEAPAAGDVFKNEGLTGNHKD